MSYPITRQFFRKALYPFWFSSSKDVHLWSIFLFIKYDSQKDRVRYVPLFKSDKLGAHPSFTMPMMNFMAENQIYYWLEMENVANTFATQLKAAVLW